MRSGRLRDVVSLANPTSVDDGSGGFEVTYVPCTPATVRADVQALRGTERLQAAALDIVVSHRVVMRRHPQVTGATRITWGTRVLDLVGPPVENEDGRVFECHCTERVV